MNTLERTIAGLCREVDWLEEQLAEMTKDRDEWREKLIGTQLQDIEHGKAWADFFKSPSPERTTPPPSWKPKRPGIESAPGS